MTSEIRTNTLTSRAGMSTVTMTDSGPMFSGITTFVDNSGFTFGVGGGTSIFTPATNVLTFGTNNTEKVRIDANGNTNIAGVTTAANFKTGVSNLHDVGLTLSGGQIDVGSNIKIGTAGVVTATSFVGSGANLTSLPSQLTLSNNADNRVITGGSGVNLNGESNLTFDGSTLNVSGKITNSASYTSHNANFYGGDVNTGGVRIEVAHSTTSVSGNTASASFPHHLLLSNYSGTGSADNRMCSIGFDIPTTSTHANAVIAYQATAAGTGDLQFHLESGNSISEKLRITSGGNVNIGGEYTQTTYPFQLTGSGGGDAAAMAIKNLGSHPAKLHLMSGHGNWSVSNSTTVGDAFEVRDEGANSTRMIITSTGKLLVGATSGSNHHISSGSDTLNTVFQANLGGAGATCAIRIKMNTSANDGLQIQQNGSGTSIAGGAHATSIFNRENGRLRFGTNNSERLLIESNGHVYAQSQFTIRGELNMMHASQNQAKYFDIGFQDNSFNMRRTNYQDGGHSNFITVNASKVVSGDFHDTSDEKLKKNIATISDGAIEDIKKLRPVTFDWIDETQHDNVSGFIAQEVKQVLPNLVDGTEYDPTYNDESLGSKGGIKSEGYSINSVGVTAHLTKAVQELITKVETLEQENIALRVRVTNLEGE